MAKLSPWIIGICGSDMRFPYQGASFEDSQVTHGAEVLLELILPWMNHIAI